MSKLWVIAFKDIGEAFRSCSIYVFFLVSLFLTLSYVTTYNRFVSSLSSQEAIINYSRGFMNSLAYILPLMYSIFICSIFANYSVILDKAKRTIESLMATPVSIKQIWMGKSLAVMLPSVAIGLSISILAYVVLSLVFVIPKTHIFILPDLLAVLSALVVVPVMIFTIVMVVIYIQLVIANPRIASFVFTGIFVLLVISINAIGAQGFSLNFFPLVYLGVIVICALVSLLLSRSLTKERVLLSSKI